MYERVVGIVDHVTQAALSFSTLSNPPVEFPNPENPINSGDTEDPGNSGEPESPVQSTDPGSTTTLDPGSSAIEMQETLLRSLVTLGTEIDLSGSNTSSLEFMTPNIAAEVRIS